MANLKGLAGFVSELRAERTNLVDRLRHVDAALSVLGKLGGRSSHTKPRRTMSAHDLRIQFGDLQNGQHLPSTDLVPNIHEDAADVARHLGVNIDLLKRPEFTGERNDVFE